MSKKIEWNAVRLPGVAKPCTKPPFRFFLRPGDRSTLRAAFDGLPQVTRNSILCFEFHSPTSSAMFPDIVRGDFGYPTIRLINSLGTWYRFSRGNLKDFFDIRRPNERQVVALPVGAFVFDHDLKMNVPDGGKFFDSQILGLAFDFLCHPIEKIDIEIGRIWLDTSDRQTGFAVQDLVIFERTGQVKQLPVFLSETSSLSMGVTLSNAGSELKYGGAKLRLTVLEDEAVVDETEVKLSNENTYVTLMLPEVGPYTLSATVNVEDGAPVVSSWPICRVLSRDRSVKSTILGISDEYEYDRIAAAGGSWDRFVVALQSIVPNGGGFRFTNGNPIPATRPLIGNFRVIAPAAMPKWLSNKSELPDYYQYGPADWKRYAQLVNWLAKEALSAGVTHFEVWNEASALGHWNDNVETLIELHRVTYQAVKSVSPNLVVLGGCTHSWTFEHLRRFFEAGGTDHCDGLSLHAYTYQPHQFLEQFDLLDALLKEFIQGRPNFKTHITEIGFRYPAFSLADQAKYLMLYTFEAASRDSVAAILWFRYINPRAELTSGYRQNSSTGYSLVGNSDRYCRPIYAAYRFAERLLQVFDYVRASGPAGARKYEFLLNEQVQAVALFGNEPVPVTEGWTAVNIFGGPVKSHAELYVSVSPEARALLIS